MFNLNEHLKQFDATKVRELCVPLQRFGIYFFMYYISYRDGSELKLTTHPDWTREFVDQGFHDRSFYAQDPKNLSEGFYLADYVEEAPILEAQKKFDIGHKIGWVNPMEDYCEIIHFGGSPENKELVNFYINHLDLLRQFIVYFKNAAAKTIESMTQKKFIMPNRFDRNMTAQRNFTIEDDDIEAFKKDIRIKRYYLDGEFKGVFLSARELDCIQALSGGKSNREIAEVLHISQRTVETHIAHIMDKLGLSNRSGITETLLRQGILA